MRNAKYPRIDLTPAGAKSPTPGLNMPAMTGLLSPDPKHDNVVIARMSANIRNFHGWNDVPLPVPPDEYARRLAIVQEAMRSASPGPLDVLVVKSPEDILWLTGFRTIGDGPPQTLLVSSGEKSDPNMVTMQARLIECDLVVKYSWVRTIYSCPDAVSGWIPLGAALDDVLVPLTKTKQTLVVGLQNSIMSFTDYNLLRDQLLLRSADAMMQDTTNLIEDLRLQRSPFELSAMRQASEISEMAMRAALDALRKPSIRLSDVDALVYSTLLQNGSQNPSYLPMVRTTDNSGHGSWEVGECVEPGQLVFIEFGASVISGHHAPMMRTAYILDKSKGEIGLPSWVKEAEEKINRVFDTCLPMMKPGAIPAEVDAVGRKIMTSNSWGGLQSARLAYTAGGTATNPGGNAGWGDGNFSIVGWNREQFREGMTFHFIPWFQNYTTEPRGPIGLSDLVVVTKDGGKRIGCMPLKITAVELDA